MRLELEFGLRILSYLKAPLVDRFTCLTLGLSRGPMQTQRMEGGNNLSATFYCEYLLVIVVDNSLDAGVESDTEEGEFKNGYQSIQRHCRMNNRRGPCLLLFLNCFRLLTVMPG